MGPRRYTPRAHCWASACSESRQVSLHARHSHRVLRVVLGDLLERELVVLDDGHDDVTLDLVGVHAGTHRL